MWDDYHRFIERKEYIKTLKTVTLEDVNNLFRKIFCQTNDVYFGIIGNVEEKDFYPYKKIKKMFDFRKYADKKINMEDSDNKDADDKQEIKIDDKKPEPIKKKDKVKTKGDGLNNTGKRPEKTIKDKKK